MKDFVSFTPENIEIMRKTRDLLSKYNNTKFDDNAERAEILQDMLKKHKCPSRSQQTKRIVRDSFLSMIVQ